VKDPEDRFPDGARTRGYSLPEVLIVIALIGIAVAIAIPLVGDSFRMARIRSAADQLALDLRAARTVAVVKRTTVPFAIGAAPQNSYEYTDAKGVVRRVALPAGVTIASATPSTINFLASGAVTGGATTVLEVSLGDGITERWTIQVSLAGVPTLTKVRV
jgi:prepilin-type N-terminal cleavage/methylation domain-containing protein